ncbi:MAG: hypothetical protein FWH08_02400 [Oscillospiraceae bacterium]|nr:hypothetical protein [Oscillospiraceae bacterium]
MSNNNTEKPACLQCKEVRGIVANGRTSALRQRFSCKLCGMRFTVDTTESEDFKHNRKIEDRAKARARIESILHCPYCKSKDDVIKDGAISKGDFDEKLQRFKCRKCKKYFTKETIERLIEEEKILAKYLVYVDGKKGEDGYHIHAWFVTEIAERLNISVHTLRRIAIKYDDIIVERAQKRKEKYK